MKRVLLVLGALALGAGFAAACGGYPRYQPPPVPYDAGYDAGMDAGYDAGYADAGTDGGFDGGFNEDGGVIMY